MKTCFLIAVLVCSSLLFSQERLVTTRAFYSNMLFSESAPNDDHLSFEGFIENIRDRVPTSCVVRMEGEDKYNYCNIEEVKRMLGKVHNILFETFYTCATTAPRASKFYEAVDGKHTPDSHHYASLVHSALLARGVKTDFFSTPTHYGIHYQDPATQKELYWCIITAQANKKPASNFREYIKIFNKYKNPEINGVRDLIPSEIQLISEYNFYKKLSNGRNDI